MQLKKFKIYSNNKFKLIVAIILIIFTQKSFCQSEDDFKKDLFYYDLLGHTQSIFSLNYERNILKISNFSHLNIRTGIGFEGGYKVEGEKYNSRKTIPTAVNLLIGKKHHFINLSAGYSMTFTKGLIDESVTPNRVFPRFDSAISFGLGYRFMYDDIIVEVYPVKIKSKDSEKYETSMGMSFGIAF